LDQPSGKTHLVEAAAEILFGDRNAVIKIDCAEFQHSHADSQADGLPVLSGYRETRRRLTGGESDNIAPNAIRLRWCGFDDQSLDSRGQLLLGVLDGR
jgi:hypothetical protein